MLSEARKLINVNKYHKSTIIIRQVPAGALKKIEFLKNQPEGNRYLKSSYQQKMINYNLACTKAIYQASGLVNRVVRVKIMTEFLSLK